MAITRLAFCGSGAAYAEFQPKTEAEVVIPTTHAFTGISGLAGPLSWDDEWLIVLATSAGVLRGLGLW